MTLTGETNWRWEKFFLQISNRAPLLEGEVDLFISTGEIKKKKENWYLGKEGKGRCAVTSKAVSIFSEEREKAM